MSNKSVRQSKPASIVTNTVTILFCELALVISVHWKKKIDMTMKTKFAISIHAQVLNTIYSQYKRMSESVVITQNVRLPGKRDFSNFTEIRLHKIFPNTVCVQNQYVTLEVNNHYVN
jgi:hypothetical protein